MSVLGFVILERAWKKQSSCSVHLKEGDTNTKFLHLRINAQKRKNHMQRLKKDQGWATTHKEKEQMVFEHYSQALRSTGRRHLDFNWETMDIEHMMLQSLEAAISVDEVLTTISQIPGDG